MIDKQKMQQRIDYIIWKIAQLVPEEPNASFFLYKDKKTGKRFVYFTLLVGSRLRKIRIGLERLIRSNKQDINTMIEMSLLKFNGKKLVQKGEEKWDQTQ